MAGCKFLIPISLVLTFALILPETRPTLADGAKGRGVRACAIGLQLVGNILTLGLKTKYKIIHSSQVKDLEKLIAAEEKDSVAPTEKEDEKKNTLPQKAVIVEITPNKIAIFRNEEWRIFTAQTMHDEEGNILGTRILNRQISSRALLDLPELASKWKTGMNISVVELTPELKATLDEFNKQDESQAEGLASDGLARSFSDLPTTDRYRMVDGRLSRGLGIRVLGLTLTALGIATSLNTWPVSFQDDYYKTRVSPVKKVTSVTFGAAAAAPRYDTENAQTYAFFDKAADSKVFNYTNNREAEDHTVFNFKERVEGSNAFAQTINDRTRIKFLENLRAADVTVRMEDGKYLAYVPLDVLKPFFPNDPRFDSRANVPVEYLYNTFIPKFIENGQRRIGQTIPLALRPQIVGLELMVKEAKEYDRLNIPTALRANHSFENIKDWKDWLINTHIQKNAEALQVIEKNPQLLSDLALLVGHPDNQVSLAAAQLGEHFKQTSIYPAILQKMRSIGNKASQEDEVARSRLMPIYLSGTSKEEARELLKETILNSWGGESSIADFRSHGHLSNDEILKILNDNFDQAIPRGRDRVEWWIDALGTIWWSDLATAEEASRATKIFAHILDQLKDPSIGDLNPLSENVISGMKSNPAIRDALKPLDGALTEHYLRRSPKLPMIDWAVLNSDYREKVAKREYEKDLIMTAAYFDQLKQRGLEVPEQMRREMAERFIAQEDPNQFFAILRHLPNDSQILKNLASDPKVRGIRMLFPLLDHSLKTDSLRDSSEFILNRIFEIARNLPQLDAQDFDKIVSAAKKLPGGLERAQNELAVFFLPSPNHIFTQFYANTFAIPANKVDTPEFYEELIERVLKLQPTPDRFQSIFRDPTPTPQWEALLRNEAIAKKIFEFARSNWNRDLPILPKRTPEEEAAPKTKTRQNLSDNAGDQLKFNQQMMKALYPVLKTDADRKRWVSTAVEMLNSNLYTDWYWVPYFNKELAAEITKASEKEVRQLYGTLRTHFARSNFLDLLKLRDTNRRLTDFESEIEIELKN